MNITEKLELVRDCKSDIKDAIEAKGVTVGDAAFDEYATKIGEISGGAEEAPENDVNFYDYDGRRVASFTIAEAKALTQAEYDAILPPAHEGLTFQEWNWSLSDITSYNRRYIDIGANYAPTDGKCHIKVHIPYDGFEYVQSTGRVAPGATLATTFDWGDGSTQQYSGSTTTHTYAQAGDYDITIYPNSSSPKLGEGDPSNARVEECVNQKSVRRHILSSSPKLGEGDPSIARGEECVLGRGCRQASRCQRWRMTVVR